VKKSILLFGLLLGLVPLSNAELATNFTSFSLQLIPLFPTNPGPNSSLPYPPSLTLVTYEANAGTVVLEATNNAATVDFSSSIASYNLHLSMSQPLWNAINCVTNPVQFGSLEMRGITLSSQPFSVTNLFESNAEYKHWNAWSTTFSVSGYGDAFIVPTFTSGSGFSGDAVDIWGHYHARTPPLFDPAGHIEWNDGNAVHSGYLLPGFQQFMKSGRLSPLYQSPMPESFDDTNDTSSVYWSQAGNSGSEGIVHTVLYQTNDWELIHLRVPIPLSNGDTNPPPN